MLVNRVRPSSLVMMVLLAATLVAAQVSPSSDSSQTLTLGSIRGRVVNESGQPLPRATVSIVRFDSPRGEQTTLTDRDGNFELNGLERVRYRIFARLRAYAPAPSDPGKPFDDSYRVGDSVTLVLMKGGVITGAVTNQAGEPVVGARVRARLVHDAEPLAWPYAFLPQERLTDDRGVYRLYGLAAGTYVVSAGGPGEWTRRPNAYENDVPTYFPASTRDTAEEIAVRAGEEITNIDIRYRGDPGHRVSGKASGLQPGDTMGFGIRLQSAADRGFQGAMTTGQPADAQGFVFEGVDDGDYEIVAILMRPNSNFAVSPVKRIRVRGADVTGIELITQPLSSVSGRVVLEESKATGCTDKERPLFSETLVYANGRENDTDKYNLPFISIAGRSAASDAQGNVVLKNMLPGKYYFVPQFFAKSWYLQSISLAPSATPAAKTSKPVDAASTWTTVKAGERLAGLTITIAHGAASLQGQLSLKEGETLPEKSFVYLVPAEREKADDVLRYFVAAVSAEGKIALSNIAPGRYWVLVQPATDLSPLTTLRSPDETETRAKLRREAEAAKTEIELKPCQNLVNFQFKL